MKGIVLAGGAGSRLHPVTLGVSKQLLPVYDKPMIYYPLSVLMQAGIRDILVITTPEDQAAFIRLLGDGSRFGLNLSYEVQPSPDGIAQAFLIGREFIGADSVALVLGDNIFYGAHLEQMVRQAASRSSGATIFGYYVCDPERFGVIEFDAEGRALSIQEKPAVPKSSYAVTGLYFYDNSVLDIAAGITPSARGELEITSVNSEYLRRGELNVVRLDQSFTWLDAGSAESLLTAANTIMKSQKHTGRQVACLEEIAHRMGYITREQLHEIGSSMAKTTYGEYILDICSREERQAEPENAG